MKAGRNEPCPCGSGKKYKHCCLRAATEAPEDLVWRRMRRLLENHAGDMLRFIANAYGPSAVQEAWGAFTLAEEPFDPATPHMQAFMPWMFHRWAPDPGDTEVRDAALHRVTPTAAYLQRKGRSLDPLMRRYLEACSVAPFSFFEIVACEPGRGMRLRDVVTGEERWVAESSASRSAQPGDMLFGQLARIDDLTLLEACAQIVIPPVHKAPMVELRAKLNPGRGPLAPETLRACDAELRSLYLDLFERLSNPRLPQLRNTDGEPLSPQKLVFDIDSSQEAFDALKHLALDIEDAELLREAERDAQGRLARVEFPWRKRGNRVHAGWDNTILGTIEIRRERLTAEVNSDHRARMLREIVEQALAGRARHRATRMQSVKKLLGDARRSPGSRAAKLRAESNALAGIPEVKAKLAEILGAHYDRWADGAIPALGGKTPREAVQDPDGREIVESLLRQMERDGARMVPPLDPGVIQRLRDRLRLA